MENKKVNFQQLCRLPKQFITFFLFPALLAVIQSTGLAAENDKITVLRVGVLIDGSGKEPLKDAAIVIKGKRISAVGRYVDVTLPKNAKILDLRNKTALPGLIDAHAHYKDWQSEIYLNHGVTTAFDIGAPMNLSWSLLQKEGIDKGKILGPRLVVGGRINAPRAGGGGAIYAGGLAEIFVESVDQAREQVRKVLSLGADCVKALENLSPEMLRAIVEEAHRAGKCVITHSVNGTEAVLAGVEIDSIEHYHSVPMATIKSAEAKKRFQEQRTAARGTLGSQEGIWLAEEDNYERVIKAMVPKNTHWTPTIASAWRAFSPRRETFFSEEMKLYSLPDLRYVPDYFRQNTKKFFTDVASGESGRLERLRLGYTKLKDLVQRFVKAGGAIQTGSDPNTIMPGFAIHTELELLVEAGLSPMEAIQGATINPAKMVRREQDFGTLAPGRFADILIVDGNPLEKISDTRKISMVFKEGRPVDLRYHANYRNPIPRPIPDRTAPRINSVSPDVVTQGEGPLTLTIRGANFLSTAVVKLNGRPLPTQVSFRDSTFLQNFITSEEISATVNPNLLQKPVTYSVVVEHPGAGGAVSNTAYLMVKFR